MPGLSKKHATRGYWSLFATQFQGAFSDNLFKFLVIFLIAGMGLPEAQEDLFVPLVGALFALPFILFSMAGGYLADRFSKRSVAIGTKITEVGIMCLALAGFALGNLPVLLAVIFLMSTQSAIFGPSKYGLLPELLPEKKLSWGNGTIGLGTFMAIIAGTVAAGELSDVFQGKLVTPGIILIALAFAGLAASLGITRVPSANPEKRFQPNFLGELIRQIRHIRRDRVLYLAVMGSAFFWFLAALLQPNILFYGKDVLDLSDRESSFLQAALAIGIGLGSFSAGQVSGQKIEYGLVPLGTIGLTIFSAILSIPGFEFRGAVANLGLLGFFAGFIIVPLDAIIQHRPSVGNKGSVIATASWLGFAGILLASGVYYLLTGLARLAPPAIFLASAGLTLAGAVYAIRLLPDALLRLVFWILTRTIYRLRTIGRDNIPEKGGALFVCNHLSFADAFLLLASTDRHIRFIMFQGIYERPFIRPIAQILRAIPISSQFNPREMIRSLKTVGEAIQNGEVVCIFAEGQITRIGGLLPFRRGFERIMKGVDAPIIPVHLDGVWGSIFSYEKRRFLWKLPRRIPYPVTVSFGAPMPADTNPFEVRAAVQDLSSAAWQTRKARMQPVHRQFVRTARRHPFRIAMADARTPAVSFHRALAGTVFVGRRLKPNWGDDSYVGILLPPSVPGAWVNFAALLAGKVPVNLNYTFSPDALASCIRQCGLRRIITSRVFLARLKLALPGEIVDLGKILAAPRWTEKLCTALAAWSFPGGALERFLGGRGKVTINHEATVIFSSGSTGEPKGVPLTHYNLSSNIEQLGQMFALNRRDRFLGVLPFFHSFGFTGTLCLPATLGSGVVFHSNPLEARIIGDLVQKFEVTFLLATPTFLQIYTRGCSSEQFGSLQTVLVGAEKLPDRVAGAFTERFGVRPMEAYGCTECSPAVTVNTRDFRAAGFRQVGGKHGSIGLPLPGMSVRIVDPDTGAPLPANESGLLLVKGPNVMNGYLGLPEKTTEVLRDGWYQTGDIAQIDEDGFLIITDRLSRFSKIGGEMVPHIKVEDLLHASAGTTEQTFAVAGVPDEKKGERLVVLHTLAEPELKICLKKFAVAEIPNLWKPRFDDFIRVEAIPYLGSGKLDLARIRAIARGE